MKKFSVNLQEKDNPNLRLNVQLTFFEENSCDDFQMILKELLRLGFLKFDLISINLVAFYDND